MQHFTPFYRNLILFFWLASVLLLASCGALPGQQVDQCVTDDALFRDGFDDEVACGWVEYGGNDSAEIENGVMTISVGTSGVMAWSNPQRSFQDVEISALSTQVSGPNNNAYGLICRYVDDENFYAFLISGDGFYAIGKYQTGVSQVQYLTGEDPYYFVASDAINTGAASNQLRVRCVGNTLSFYVNGTLLAEVVDGTFVAGDIGVAASTLDDGRAVVEFDTVQVVAP